MGTTAEKLAYLNDTKTAIKDAIVAKGVEVPEGTTFRGYAEKIGAIETGVSGEALITITVPAGRLSGDVDGDGVFTANDAIKILEYYIGLSDTELSEYEKLIYDTDGNGSILPGDATQVSQMASGNFKYGAISRDVNQKYSIYEGYAEEAVQYYIDVAVPGLNAQSDVVVYDESQSGIIIDAKYQSDGIIRLFFVLPPVEDTDYKASISNGSGVISIVRQNNSVSIYSGTVYSGQSVDLIFDRAYAQCLITYAVNAAVGDVAGNTSTPQNVTILLNGSSSVTAFTDESGGKLSVQELGFTAFKNGIKLTFDSTLSADPYLSYKIYASNYNLRSLLVYGAY